MLTSSIEAPADLAALGARWQALEAQVECSFFQSWAWVGCLAELRCDDPVLVETRRDGPVVALALFNRRRGRWPWTPDRLWLAETGRAEWDSVFIERSGALCDPADRGALRHCLAAAAEGGRILTLSGLGQGQAETAQAMRAAIVSQTRTAPVLDLKGDHLARLSANTRHQLRRSARRYGEVGPLQVIRAETAGQRHEFLRALAALHQAAWTARGKPGAFAEESFTRFHHALIDRTEAVDLLRITAGERVVGYLHGFVHRGRVCAYQSGFDYANAPPHGKPGMTCHMLAIERYAREGCAVYDFLGGADRYKTSLASSAETLHWLTLMPRWSPQGMTARLKARVRRPG